MLYALLARRLSGVVLGEQIVVGLLGLIVTQLHFGNGGRCAVGDVYGDFPRVNFSFFADVWVHRLHLRSPAPRVPGAMVVLLLASFVPALAPAHQLRSVALLDPALIYAARWRPSAGPSLAGGWATRPLHSM